MKADVEPKPVTTGRPLNALLTFLSAMTGACMPRDPVIFDALQHQE